jgi:hypothetical protein
LSLRRYETKRASGHVKASPRTASFCRVAAWIWAAFVRRVSAVALELELELELEVEVEVEAGLGVAPGVSVGAGVVVALVVAVGVAVAVVVAVGVAMVVVGVVARAVAVVGIVARAVAVGVDAGPLPCAKARDADSVTSTSASAQRASVWLTGTRPALHRRRHWRRARAQSG